MTAGRVGVGSVVGRDFRLVAPLGMGGMGAVWRAEQLSTGKPRALKLMHPQLLDDPRCRERFVQEAQIGSRIASEHVVDVIAAGIDEDAGMPWLAMELLEGDDLAALVEKRGPLPSDEVASIARQLGHALGAAHDAGIVHRDLKPENLFLSRARRVDAPLMLKVLDFGIARLLQESKLATASQVIGSPTWMAPEQMTPGGRIGPPTDVWAIGLIAFHLLTGRAYWRSTTERGGNLQSLLAEILVHPLDAASSRAVDLGAPCVLPPDLDGWFASCVAREPAQRFRDARVALDALGEVLTTAGRPTVPELAATAHGQVLPGPAAPEPAMPTQHETVLIAAIPSLSASPAPEAAPRAPAPPMVATQLMPAIEDRARELQRVMEELQRMPPPPPSSGQIPLDPNGDRVGVRGERPANFVVPVPVTSEMPPSMFLGLVMLALLMVAIVGIALSQC